jgi:hypothetical protein
MAGGLAWFIGDWWLARNHDASMGNGCGCWRCDGVVVLCGV